MRLLPIALLTYVSFAIPASASDNYIDEHCALIGKLAAVQMEIRQLGGSLADALEQPEDSNSQLFKDSNRAIVLDAWSRPRYNTPSIQQDMIGEFRDYWHLKCLRDAEP